MKKKIILIVSSVVLVFLVAWLGYSFFSMNSTTLLMTGIDFRDNDIANKVPYSRLSVDKRRFEYTFEIIIIEVSNDESNYIITGVGKDFSKSYKDIEDAKFEYFLPKEKGKFDFSELEWDTSLLLTLEYRVEKDIRYFFEYSFCTLENITANVFNKESSNRRSACIVDRDINKWSLKISE